MLENRVFGQAGGGKNKLRDNCPVLLNVECSYHGTFRGLSYAA